jgi:hypothetical protein
MVNRAGLAAALLLQTLYLEGSLSWMGKLGSKVCHVAL